MGAQNIGRVVLVPTRIGLELRAATDPRSRRLTLAAQVTSDKPHANRAAPHELGMDRGGLAFAAVG